MVGPRLMNSGGKISNNEQHTHNFNFIKQLEISYNLLKAFSYLMTKEEKLNRKVKEFSMWKIQGSECLIALSQERNSMDIS